MKCKLILKDKTELSFGVNGTNLISKTKIDETLFTEDNLSVVSVQVDKAPAVEYTDLVFIQQILFEGEYYLAFRQKTEDEKREERMAQLEAENAELQQRCLETEAALIEVVDIMEAK